MSVLDQPTTRSGQRRISEREFTALLPVGLCEPDGIIARDAEWQPLRPPLRAPVPAPGEFDDAPITVGDLLGWPESPLHLSAPLLRTEGLDRRIDRPLLWRASAPPPTQPGALVLAPDATLRRLGTLLPGALAALAQSGVAALVLDPGAVIDFPSDGVPLLQARSRITETTERDLQHLLLVRRNGLYQRRYALERMLADNALAGRPRADLLRLGAAQLGRAIYLLDDGGATLGVYGNKYRSRDAEAQVPPPPGDTAHATVQIAGSEEEARWLFARVTERATPGGWLAIGDPTAAFDEGDRLVLHRLATAYAAADGQRTPTQRGEVVAELLRPALAAKERRELAASLRLKQNGTFAVLRLVVPDMHATAWQIARTLQHLLLDARVRAEIFTTLSGLPAGLLLHTESDDPAPIRAASAALRTAHQDDPDILAAVSGATFGLDRLPEADGEAHYGLALLQAGLVRGAVVAWDGNGLGPYRLLYPLWGEAHADDFMRETLGGLLDRDARQTGELLQTLLAYIGHGGSGSDTAARLAIHRNTLTYRLRQIAQLTEHSLTEPQQTLSLILAALLWTLPPRRDTATSPAAAN